MPETDGVSEGNNGVGGAHPSGGGTDGGVSEETKSSVDAAMSEGPAGDEDDQKAAEGHTDTMTVEDAMATQDRMQIEAHVAKSAYVSREEARQTAAVVDADQSYADALDQEVVAMNAVAMGVPLTGLALSREATPAPTGHSIGVEADVVQAAYEIQPTNEIFGRTYGVVTQGRAGFETEQQAVEAFQGVVEWYRSGDGAAEYELGTTIYETADGEFGHNDIVTFYDDSSVSPFLDVPEGATLVAIAHSHPAPTGFSNNLLGYDGEDFSGTDVSAAERYQRQFGDDFSLYMVSPTNELRVYPEN